MSKHTPGPWVVWDEARAIHRWCIAKENGYSVASAEPVGPWVTPEEADANARLIAAAPDLLDALQDAKRLIEDMARFVGQMALEDYALLNETPIKIDAALRRARPEETAHGQG